MQIIRLQFLDTPIPELYNCCSANSTTADISTVCRLINKIKIEKEVFKK